MDKEEEEVARIDIVMEGVESRVVVVSQLSSIV